MTRRAVVVLAVALCSCAKSPLLEPDGGSIDEIDAGCPNCVLTSTPLPTCGTDFNNYRNPGFAACACVGVLHHGHCLAGEGQDCATSACPLGLDCRSADTRCVARPCTNVSDCRAQSCADGGVASVTCPSGGSGQGACTYFCG